MPVRQKSGGHRMGVHGLDFVPPGPPPRPHHKLKLLADALTCSGFKIKDWFLIQDKGGYVLRVMTIKYNY